MTIQVATSVYAALCTVHYFYALLRRPEQLSAMALADNLWVQQLVFAYRMGAVIGVSAMAFLALKEIYFFIQGHRLGVAYDDYIGLPLMFLAFVFLNGLDKIAVELTASRRAAKLSN
jgi:hypothetical protein